MNRVLLIKPRFDYFPIGMAHVMTALRQAGIPYDFVDMLLDGEGWREKLARGDYSAVGAGALSGDFNTLCELVPAIKAMAPDTPFILGGNITFDMPRHILFDNIPLDYAVVGEGEVTFPELLQCLVESGDVAGVPGVVMRGPDGGVHFTGRRSALDLRRHDSWPTWDEVDMAHYLRQGYGDFASFRGIPVLTGRGCTGKCTFCSPTNGAFRFRDIEAVIAEMDRLHRTYDFDGFAFMNEIFYPSKALIRRFADAYKASGMSRPWVCLIRVDAGEDVLSIMRDAGCVGVSFGVESGSDRVLGVLRKNTQVDKIKAFAAASRRVGIPAFGSFMLGCESETAQEMAATIDLMTEMDLFGPSGLIVAYPGTQIYANAREKGLIPNELRYIRELNYTTTLETGTYRDVNYLNISAIPDAEFFPAVLREFRRFRTHFFTSHSARDLDPETMQGTCPVCGAALAFALAAHSPFISQTSCPQCYTRVTANLPGLSCLAGHLAELGRALAGRSRIAVWGVRDNARSLMLLDLVGLDLDRVVACVDDTGEWGGKHFYNAPVCSPEGLAALRPDAVLAADVADPGRFLATVQAAGLDRDRILRLLPDSWIDHVRRTFAGHRDLAEAYYRGGYMGNLPVPGNPAYPGHLARVAAAAARRPELHGRRILMMPAGGFARDLSRRLAEAGLEVTAFADSYAWQKASECEGRPLVSPEALGEAAFDTLLLATPNRALQAGLADLVGPRLAPGQDMVGVSDLLLDALLDSLSQFSTEDRP